MFDTYVTIVGNVLSAPESRRTVRTGTAVTNFKVASTARRFDRATETWVDGDSLRVKVACWRRLGEHVSTSIVQGDPVIVTGRLSTREYETETGEKRISYELEAIAVGHDLARGTGRFSRWRPAPTEMVEDGSEDEFAGGEPTEAVEEQFGELVGV
ncbi:single-stranded DNA-binding protein [Longispora sp. K20-0274]|uniref:single-stranded DNA-binding protein n=1 Tax=Longispora sp. K20-0274 TaxID=3088255 RepID=UPI00399C31E1